MIPFLRTARAPAKRPVDVLFLPWFGDSNPYQRELRAAIEARGLSVDGARSPGRDPVAILRAWLGHGRPRVVHLHWTHPYLGQRAKHPEIGVTRLRAAIFLGQVLALRALRVRIVWTVHNLGHHEGSRGDPRELSAHRRLVGMADAMICHCHSAVEALTATYGVSRRDAAKVHVIPHGSYVDVYGPAVERSVARAALQIDPDARVLLFVGSVRAYKGVADLVAAFAKLPGAELKLVVAGRPATSQDASSLVGLAGADRRIDLRLGFVPDAELPVLLGAADAVVLPFRDVLTSGSAILAMSYGRAVVAPSLGCLPQTLDRNGAVLYDPDAPEALARALETALNSDLDAMGRHNLEVARQLAWGPIAAATIALYGAS